MDVIRKFIEITRPIRYWWPITLLKSGVSIICQQFIKIPMHKEQYSKLKTFHNIHKGERVFIIATGPSLTIEDINKLKNEITFGMNSVFKLYPLTDWRPTYYSIIDHSVFERFYDGIHNLGVKAAFCAHDMDWNDLYVFKLPLIRNFCTIRKHRDIVPSSWRKKRMTEDISKVIYEGTSVVHAIMQICI